MAELALAVIPLGLQTCSGLVSYLGRLKDHDDAIARLKHLTESLEGSFHLLDGLLKSGQLNSSTSQAVAQALRCLGNCEDGLNDLKAFGDKISATTTADPKLGDKVKGSYRRIIYPLRQAQLAQLENTLKTLCTPLNLAVQSLQLELQAATSSTLTLNTTRLQKSSADVLAAAADVSGLRDPISNIETKLPSIQASVEDIASQINLMIQAQFKSQMDEIRHSFQQAESSSLRRNAQTNEILSQLHIDCRTPVTSVYKLAAKPSALSTVASSVLACSCRARRVRQRKALRVGPLYFIDETMTELAHYNDCEFSFVEPKYSRNRTLRFSSIVRLVNKAVELTLHTTGGAGGFSISPSFTYFAEVDEKRSPAFRVLGLLMRSSYEIRWAMLECPELFVKSIISKLQAIFSSGTARPTDLSSRGSLLHLLSRAMKICGPIDLDLIEKQISNAKFKPLFEFLITAGVPVSAVDSGGWMAWHIAANDLVLPITIINEFHVEDIEVGPVAASGIRSRHLSQQDIMKYDDWNHSQASKHCKDLLAKQLQSYRLELEQIAQNKLPGSIHGVYYSLVSETGVKTMGCDRILRERDLTDHEDAVLFWDLGFPDIDDDWADWGLAHWVGPGIGNNFESFLRKLSPAYAMWLYEHCPNLWSLVCEHRKPESPVFVFAEVILNHHRDHATGYDEMLQYLIDSPIATEATDDCICQCSPQGCTPFSHGIKFLDTWYYRDISPLRFFVSQYGRMLSLSQHVAVLRQATFQKLDMEHTCIDKPGHFEDRSSESEVDPTEKDLEMETHLNELVMEYQAFLLRDADDSPEEEGDFSEEYSVEAGTRRYWRAMDFWDSIWPLRVQEIEQELASSWNPDQEVLEDLGVSLWLEDEKQPEKFAAPSEEDRWRSFREMMDELDMIE
ncbi:hypothetical protein FGLOB1_3860 [Fusarium globosum]|uniref:Fungal N-terminal domain-containing protein n=1 Tax=Fusarium globosum TaxID=78864 RepID=A0A8H5YLM2_9HYPO|nr:hypothetical protein FGLOB1_3860 [Fusarium globosum]